MQASLISIFTIFLLEDQYGIADSEAAAVLGNLGTVADVVAFSTELFIGYAIDLFGRKMLSIAGVILAGTGTFCSPLPARLGGLYFFRVMITIGILPLHLSPYIIDYVKRESIGRALAYLSVGATISSIFTSSVAIQLQKSMGAAPVYYIVGSCAYIVAFVLCYGLKDVHEKAKDKLVVLERE